MKSDTQQERKMTDRLTKAQRSDNMSRIRGKNTKPEIIVRSLIHRLGLRFRLHTSGLPGRPDVVLRRHETVVFVHGCFWHRHRNCKDAGIPKTRTEWWREKLEGNAKRDRKNARSLKRNGWRVITVWECETGKPDRLKSRLEKLLLNRSVPGRKKTVRQTRP